METERKALSVVFYALFTALIAGYFYAEFFTATVFSVSRKLTVCFAAFVLMYIATYSRVRSLEDRVKKFNTVRFFSWSMFVLYLVFLFSLLYMDSAFGRKLILFKDFHELEIYFESHSNLQLFDTILEYLEMLSNRVIKATTFNLLGNIAAFMPFGLFLPLLSLSCRRLRGFSLAMVLILLLAEGLQIIFMTGVFDVDDIVLNFIGALLVFGLVKTEFVQFIFRKKLLMI